MTITPPSVAVTVTVIFLTLIIAVNGLGSSSTLAISYSTNTVCGIVANEQNQRIECYSNRQRSTIVPIQPNVSYSSISGGRDFFCGLQSDGLRVFCWDAFANYTSKRVYNSSTVGLKDLTVGDDQVCAVENSTGVPKCWWRGTDVSYRNLSINDSVISVTSGRGFSCGVLTSNRTVKCWGLRDTTAIDIQSQFLNMSMFSLVAGYSHVCGVNATGFLVCKGNNDSGQLNFPASITTPFEFSGLALGLNHSCAIRRSNKSVVCWGGKEFLPDLVNVVNTTFFESIVAGLNFTCGLTVSNYSLICWGPGWSNGLNSTSDLPLQQILPGSCTQDSCSRCGIHPGSKLLCFGSGNICNPCDLDILQSPPPAVPLPLPPSPSSPLNKGNTTGLLIFAIVGTVGTFIGICTVIYCLWTGICCCNHKKVHNSVQPTIGNRSNSVGVPVSSDRFSPTFSRSSTIKRQSSRAMRRQRSGTSSKHTDRAEEFTLAELAVATDSFSLENKIGAGSFGTVYKGKLPDGREVAIKRGDTSLRTKKFQEKESAFQSELAFLSRLHHKHLVGLVGFCDEKDERLLVYEYMKNGALYDHLHSKSNVAKLSSPVNSWKMRIKISLDAARGIDYLHSYAVPPIIHRDIKSSNILLDANWVARVSDFGLSLLGPELEGEQMPAKAAGTVGYMDPEYYGLNLLTSKSDVYGLGVVLLELLTGKRAIFKSEEEKGPGSPISVVDFAVPRIRDGELWNLLDARVGLPELKEAEAVELVAYTAVHCVNLEGKERPSMADIVSNLERALSLCDDSHGSISSTFSIVSE